MRNSSLIYGSVLLSLLLFLSCTSEKDREQQKKAEEFNNMIEQTIHENGGKPLTTPKIVVCSVCRGTGKIICKKCNGSGSVKDIWGSEFITCPNCEGYGFFICDKCGGTGEIEE